MTLYDKVQESVTFIRSRTSASPEIGIILGSGLGSLAESVEKTLEIQYKELPHFPISTVQGHEGKLIFGHLKGKNVVLMAGRFHYYEGYDMQSVTFPVRVMKSLGVHSLMISNAAGSMHPDFAVGDIMLIKDHINLFPEHPLRGPNDERLGIRFPDMSVPYNLDYLSKAKAIAQTENILIREGVYVGLQGPTFETPAEYQYLRAITGDAVGMSTVPEVIVAIHGGMQVFAASIITDIGIVEGINKVTHEEVLAAAEKAAPLLAKIITELIGKI